MKLKFTTAERPALLGLLGLSESASDTDISAAVASRLTDTVPAPATPAPQAAAAASGPEEYPAEWLAPSDLTPVPRVAHGGD
jgi:hypothetical protein